jgi:transcriptional regulator with XRE-family HTH domain
VQGALDIGGIFGADLAARCIQPVPNRGLAATKPLCEGVGVAGDFDGAFQCVHIGYYRFSDSIRQRTSGCLMRYNIEMINPKALQGDRVKALREALGLSQIALAAAVTDAGGKLSQQQVVAYEKGETARSGSLRELAMALRTSPDYLLGLTDDIQPAPNIATTIPPLRDFVPRRTLSVWRVTPGEAMGDWVATDSAIDAVLALDGMESTKETLVFRVPDDAIAPAYEKNDIAFADLAVEPIPGHHCVICRELPGRPRAFVFVARKLMGYTDKVWKVRQYQPPREYDIPRKDMPFAFKLLGKRAR